MKLNSGYVDCDLTGLRCHSQDFFHTFLNTGASATCRCLLSQFFLASPGGCSPCPQTNDKPMDAAARRGLASSPSVSFLLLLLHLSSPHVSFSLFFSSPLPLCRAAKVARRFRPIVTTRDEGEETRESESARELSSSEEIHPGVLPRLTSAVMIFRRQRMCIFICRRWSSLWFIVAWPIFPRRQQPVCFFFSFSP